MNKIGDNIKKTKEELPNYVKLVAISKTHPAALIQEAYDAGHHIFGENKVQELTEKHDQLPKDIEWHMVGHLQTNKIKYIAPFVSMIHSVDRIKVLKEINKEAAKNNRVIPCLLQIHIASEETKYGLNKEEVIDLVNSDVYQEMQNIEINGLMGMATFTDNEELIHKEFQNLKNLFEELRNDFFKDQPVFKEISMGMSSDYKIAIEEGSTMVRIGSSIFGTRHYH